MVPRYVARPGATAVGHELVGRESMLADLTGKLATGTSVHLRAARRYGKSSVLEALVARLGGEGRPVLLLDVASVEDPADFTTKLVDAALGIDGLAAALEPLGLRPAGALDDAARRDGVALLRRVLSGIGVARGILALDEISLLLRSVVKHHGTNDAWRDLLGVLNTGSGTLPQVIAGSTGLSAFARLHGLGDVLDHLVPVSLEPLDPADARWLIEEMLLSDERRPMPDVAAAVLEHLGAAVPYFVHAFADGLRSATSPGGAVTRAAVERLHARWVAGSAATNVFAGYRLRNQAYARGCHETAKAILDAVARTPEGLPRSELEAAFRSRPPAQAGVTLDVLLPCLCEDFDLIQIDGRWSFRSKLLRERWAQGDRWLTATQAGQ
ncbi:MAG: hypothetical protein HY744_22855 [Deltaproteobacteria bacterium]|nr:hypothetical protein [Deltaproteobacteria bacterium]